MSVGQLVEQIKANNEDFEWYPTTQEIIRTLQEHCIKEGIAKDYYTSNEIHSVLDIGCGNGSFLDHFCSNEQFCKNIRKYGIEKSNILAEQLSSDIVLLGSDFEENTLIDKKVDMIFCNPPYSKYEEWTEKIIKEGNCKWIALVIPTRWKDSERIKEAMSKRKLEPEIVGTFDFNNAERKARATVDLVFLSAKDVFNGKKYRAEPVDPFDLWFEESFSINAEKSKREAVKDKVKKNLENEILLHGDTAETLVKCYNYDMEKLYNNYRKLEELDQDIFEELKVDIDNLKEALKTRLQGLKHVYWHNLFKRYDKITSRLTSTARKKVIDRLDDNTSIDFTMSNIVQLTLWIIRHSNTLFDEQLTEYFYDLCNVDSIQRYKSNKRWSDDDWRYVKEHRYGNRYDRDTKDRLKSTGCIMLDYRIIVEAYSNFDEGWSDLNLTESCITFLEDTIVIGKNFGYDIDFTLPHSYNNIKYEDWRNFNICTTDGQVFANVKLYKNGNRHIKFRKDFMQKLNVEMARINGWVQDKREAMEEMDIPADKMDEIWGSTIKIDYTSGKKLLGLPA